LNATYTITRRPPTPPPFPCTTLFRSRQAALSAPRRRAAEGGIPAWHETAVRHHIGEERSPIFIASDAPTELDDIASCARLVPEEDRKSTRLNSSHVKISYAVFCLKKK